MLKPNCECFICKKPIYRRPCRKNGHNLCSYSCRNKYFSGEKSFIWKNGASLDKNYIKKRLRVSDYKRRKKYKQKAVDLLGGKCSKCGYSILESLHFHHLNPKEKERNIKDLICCSWKRIEQEIKKCILLCANCHNETHKELRENEFRKHEKDLREISRTHC